ncbi:hypothetical protein [Spiroplasma endosymbiont of Ammophila pubescens]|uniref:hypothetical protein n=1 Tax=Spiroplasma endosymbiont of Ammophila pubescens TaxID=3066315 RepID=UPI0032B2676B
MKKLLILLGTIVIVGNGMSTAIATNSKNLKIMQNINKTELNELNVINEPISFVEKIYNNDDSTWTLSVVLSKEKLLDIIGIYVQSTEYIFITKTKEILAEIKEHSVNLSAADFDNNAIDAYAHTFFKNFVEICNLFANLGKKQQIRTILFIENGEWIKNSNLFEIIGEKTQWEKNRPPIDSYSDRRDNNIIDYAEKLFMNEKYKNIFIRY